MITTRSVVPLWRRTAVSTSALWAVGTALVLTCGPFFTDLRTVEPYAPIDRIAFDRGQLAVVKPTFARRYLVQAYRTLNGAPQASLDQPSDPRPVAPRLALQRWQQRIQAFSTIQRSGGGGPLGTTRRLQQFNSFENCLDDAFDGALRALEARAARTGPGSRELAEWLAGQQAVFENCNGTELVLPPAAPSWADATLRADRDYQIAAAHFYAMRYEEAAQRFRAIAANAQSPWRGYGRYLAGRSMLRFATVPEDGPAARDTRFTTAESDFRAALADPAAVALHASARGLLNHVAARRQPVERLHELSRRVATAPTVDPQDLTDYTWLLNRLTNLPTPDSPATSNISEGDDLTAWILAVQGDGEVAAARWRMTPSTPWLVAALWSAPPDHAAAPRIIEAAGDLPATSAAFATVSFLRVRLLIQRGQIDEARRALAALPAGADPRATAETLNLYDAARFAAAASLDELLAHAPRRLVSMTDRGDLAAFLKASGAKAAWDDDAAAVFNNRLPLDVLATAAESAGLPARLRLRVAQAAFTRAVFLDRAPAGRRAATVLRMLAPQLRGDLDDYLGAANQAERRHAATLTLLRTPGLSIHVAGMDTDASYERTGPARQFGHAFARNWWCPVKGEQPPAGRSLVFGDAPMPSPGFLTLAQRLAVVEELRQLMSAGEPRAWLTTAALDWARTTSGDGRAAEALALAVEGWRWSPCDYGSKSDLPRRAFTTLHRQFPGSEWARRTRYWYY